VVDEDQLSTLLDYTHEPSLFQSAQVFRRGQPLGDARFLDKTDLAERLFEDDLD
jgi:hypothetical protein